MDCRHGPPPARLAVVARPRRSAPAPAALLPVSDHRCRMLRWLSANRVLACPRFTGSRCASPRATSSTVSQAAEAVCAERCSQPLTQPLQQLRHQASRHPIHAHHQALLGQVLGRVSGLVPVSSPSAMLRTISFLTRLMPYNCAPFTATTGSSIRSACTRQLLLSALIASRRYTLRSDGAVLCASWLASTPPALP